MKRVWIAFIVGALLVVPRFAWAQGDVTWFGDALVAARTLSFDSSVSNLGGQDSDTSLLYRRRAGAWGKMGRASWKFRVSVLESGDLVGARFGGSAVVKLEHAYLAYKAAENWNIYAGRVPTHYLDNDFVFDTGKTRRKDIAADGVWLGFNLSEQSYLALGWVRLSDSPGNVGTTDAFYGQIWHKFSDAFWAYVGGVNISADGQPEDYSAFFAKAAYDFTPDFTVWVHFLGSNGSPTHQPEVANSDTSAFGVGAKYKVHERLSLSAWWAALGGSALYSTAFQANDYLAKYLQYGPAGSADTDLNFFNFRLTYKTTDNAEVVVDFTWAEEQDVSPSNSGTGVLVWYAVDFGQMSA